MSNTVQVTTLQDGSRYAIVHVFVKSDGSEGEIIDQVLYTPAGRLRIDEIWWDFSGFGMRLEYDDIPDEVVWTVSPGASNHICFDKIGGLADRSGVDATYRLQFSTYGLTGSDKQGSMVIKLSK